MQLVQRIYHIAGCLKLLKCLLATCTFYDSRMEALILGVTLYPLS